MIDTWSQLNDDSDQNHDHNHSSSSSSSSSSISNDYTFLQSHYIHSAGYSHFRIEWLSECYKLRSLQLEWKPPGATSFSIIPSSSLFFSLDRVFSYPDRIVTCRMNKYYNTEPLVDDRLLQTLSHQLESERKGVVATSSHTRMNKKNKDFADKLLHTSTWMDVTFTSSCPLPQGLSLDPRDGTISGYPTMESEELVIGISMEVGERLYFNTTVQITVIGCRY